MENCFNDTLDLKKGKDKVEKYSFELPTRITKLEPVFYLWFNIDKINHVNCTVDVALNPKLSEFSDQTKIIKKYQFNSDGSYRFDNEEINGYYIDGEMRIIETEIKPDKSCFVSITYGNKDEALHYIKGIFRLNDKTE